MSQVDGHFSVSGTNVKRMFSQGFGCEIIAKALGSTIEEVNDVLSDTFEDAELFK